jgi:large subunit ribosomal protein L25
MVKTEFSIEATTRTAELRPAELRRTGIMPAVIYGKLVEPVKVAVNAHQFKKLISQAGESSLVNIQLAGGEPRVVLIKSYQFDPRTGDPTHADFYQVNLLEKIRTIVPLEFIGEAPAVAQFDALFITPKDEVEVECLPADLPHAIEVDISKMANVNDEIFVRDLVLPSGVVVLDNPEELLAVINEKREEEVAPVVASEAEAVAGVEVTGEKPTDEAAPEK